MLTDDLASTIAELREHVVETANEDWCVLKTNLEGRRYSVVNKNGEAECGNWFIAGGFFEDNMKMIVAMQKALPKLLDRIAELEKALQDTIDTLDGAEGDAEIRKLREAVEKLADRLINQSYVIRAAWSGAAENTMASDYAKTLDQIAAQMKELLI